MASDKDKARIRFVKELGPKTEPPDAKRSLRQRIEAGRASKSNGGSYWKAFLGIAQPTKVSAITHGKRATPPDVNDVGFGGDTQGSVLRAILEEKELTPEAFATMLEIDPMIVNGWLADEKAIGPNRFQDIVTKLSLTDSQKNSLRTTRDALKNRLEAEGNATKEAPEGNLLAEIDAPSVVMEAAEMLKRIRTSTFAEETEISARPADSEHKYGKHSIGLEPKEVVARMKESFGYGNVKDPVPTEQDILDMEAGKRPISATEADHFARIFTWGAGEAEVFKEKAAAARVILEAKTPRNQPSQGVAIRS